MTKKIKYNVAIIVCEECGGYHDAKFCANCGSEVDKYNRCDKCNKFVKTTPCKNCYGTGNDGELRVGDKCTIYCGVYSTQEIKDHVGFKGYKHKYCDAKVIEITGRESCIVRVKGKDLDVSTEYLMQ